MYTLIEMAKFWWNKRHPRHHWIVEDLSRYSIQWLKTNLPIIIQPTIDVDHHNELIAVFVSISHQRVHLNLIYCYRKFKWFQGIHIRQLSYDRSVYGSWLTIFTSDYCKSQTWKKGFQHYSTVIPRNSWTLQSETTRPILYVNTLTHLHGPVNLNPEFQMTTWSTYPVFIGDTKIAEHFVQTVGIHREAGGIQLQSTFKPVHVWS